MSKRLSMDEAVALAAKREAHKPRSMTHKNWMAVHTPERGWHPALVEPETPSPNPIAQNGES